MKMRWQFGVAAAIIALLSVIIFVPRGSSTHEELYADYFHPHEDVILVNGDGDQRLFAQGMEAYNAEDFKKAADLIQEYLNTGTLDFTAQFYLGIALIESGRATEGVQYLGNVVNSRNMLIEHAQWYRALGLLKLNRMGECKALLKQIDKEGHDHQLEAQELLKKLE